MTRALLVAIVWLFSASATVAGMPPIPPPAVPAGGYSQVPKNNSFCSLGDSRIAHAFLITGGSQHLYQNYGPQTWLAQISNRKVEFPLTMAFAVSGSTTAQAISTQLPQVLASTCGNVLMLTGTNDTSDSTANYRTLVSAMIAAGKHVWILAEMPRGTSTFPAMRLSGPGLLVHLSRRNWLLSTFAAYGPRVHVIDVYAAMYDPANTATGDIVAAYTYDGLHENIAGAYLMATLMQPEVNRVFAATPLAILTGASTYDATNNPSGALNPNLDFTGTGGTCTAPCTGTVASNWAVTLSTGLLTASGLTATASQVTTSPISGAGNWQQLSISGTSATASVSYARFQQTVTVSGKITAGDVVEGICQYEADTTTGLYGLTLKVDRANTGADLYQDGVPNANTQGNLPAGPISGTLRTPPVTMAGTETASGLQLLLWVQDASPTAFNATVRVRSCYLHKLIAAF